MRKLRHAIDYALVRYLRRRGWIAFWLDEPARYCNRDADICWLALYRAEVKATWEVPHAD